MSGKKILLVDHDAAFVRTMSTALAGAGYDVVTAEDGSGALSALHQGKPDLILLEILFPPDVAHGGGVGWDGFLIADWLRRMGGIGPTPIVFITAANPAEYAERARKAGAFALFPKTVEVSVVLGLIQQRLAEPAIAA